MMYVGHGRIRMSFCAMRAFASECRHMYIVLRTHASVWCLPLNTHTHALAHVHYRYVCILMLARVELVINHTTQNQSHHLAIMIPKSDSNAHTFIFNKTAN